MSTEVEIEYGIAVGNKYGGFSDEDIDDPFEYLNRQEELKKKEAESAARVKSSAKGKKQTKAKQPQPPREEKQKNKEVAPSSQNQGRRDGEPNRHPTFSEGWPFPRPWLLPLNNTMPKKNFFIYRVFFM